MDDNRHSYILKESEDLKNLMRELTELRGVSSDESVVSERLKSILDSMCDRVIIDSSGNVIGTINAPGGSDKTVMLEAHMDSIGLMVSGITQDGFVKFVNIGGVDERILSAAKVVILGETETEGVIFPQEKITDKNPKVEQMCIDTGFDANELKNRIKIGDTIIISNETAQLCGSVISGPAMDNRAGIASILTAVSALDRAKLKYNIAVLFAVEEELGLHGACTGTGIVNPDAAIVVDVTHGTTPDAKDEVGVFPLGAGAIICRGPNFDYEYTKQLLRLAKEKSIPYKIEVASGPSGTDAWVIQISGDGVPSMLVSIPLRYMHTNVETLDLSDVSAVAMLIKAAMEGGLILD